MDLSPILQLMFFVSLGLVLYVYLGYPLLVRAIARLAPKTVRKCDITPRVSFIITAFNEERHIGQKLDNTMLLDYPNDRLEVIVASDCSTDATDEIVQSFADRGVRLVRQTHRAGKTAAQNLAVEKASGEIVLFSDATSRYRPDVVKVIAANFADAEVGGVAGKLVYVDPSDSAVGSGARTYWSYESFLKENESTACSLIGVSGCLYAVRRENYVPMYPEACSDFLIATILRKQGLRTVYEPGAVCTEITNRRSGKEMRMRVRVISQTFTDLWRNREMLNPFRSGFFAVQLISHKVLRYGVPVLLLVMLLTSLSMARESRLFLAAFLLQACFYGAAGAAWLLERLGFKPGPFSIPMYFVLANIASAVGFFQFIKGERYASWEPIRDSG